MLKKYLSLVKFSHTIFAMPFALIGFFLGVTHFGVPFRAEIFLFVILCMVFARNAAMGFNRYLDRDIDKINPRTANREIPAGQIKPKSALAFVIANSILFIATTFFINENHITFYLSPVALMVVLGYSYTKRFTSLCHLVLGLGLSLAPIGAFLAVTGKFAILPALFSGAVLLWVSGFDIIYALQDKEFDESKKLHSIPTKMGKRKALRLSSLLHVLSGSLIVLAGIVAPFGVWYLAGAVFFVITLIYQHLLVSPTDLSKVNLAFFTTNGVASVVFSLFVFAELYL